MTEPTYKVSCRYGSVEFAPAPPGYSRLVTRDESGVVVKDVSSHLVCLGFDGVCHFCGKKMN